MKDLKNLLQKALDESAAPAPVDPAADLARGRSRLLRRRAGVAAGAAAVVLGIGIVPLAVNHPGPERVPLTAAATDRPSASAGEGLPALSLVAYTGRQQPGYRVDAVPEGWEIQGSDSYVLTIAEKGAQDTDYTTFYGKIAIMLQSKDAQPPTEGTVLSVDGRPGRLSVDQDTQLLTYPSGDGRWMEVQAPTALGWDGAELARFAAGVEVLDNAEAGSG